MNFSFIFSLSLLCLLTACSSLPSSFLSSKKPSPSITSYKKIGDQAYDQEDFLQAEKFYIAGHAYKELVKTYIKQKKIDQAMFILEKYCSDTDIEILNLKAVILTYQKNFSAAITIYKNLLLKNQHPTFIINLSLIYIFQHDYHKALHLVENYILSHGKTKNINDLYVYIQNCLPNIV